MKLYNTLSHSLEEFEPIDPANVKIYTCGPTVYGPVHIGNLRTYTVGDILVRALRNQGYKVIHVENITDVDDKTIRSSREKKVSLKEFTSDFTNAYFKDLDNLNILRPTQSPRATEQENITAMIDMISSLIKSGHAYKSEDGVYYRISSDPEYGKLAGKVGPSSEGPTFRSRIKNDEYEKEAVGDFALWKFQTPEDGEVGWDAPFGKGRPGWHIECSAMIHRLLGEPIDIHTGGVDLIFPHHTNEIAQTESAFGDQVANIWLHNEFIQVDGKKMSKSLGNVITLREIIKKGFSPLALRYLFLTTHYRQKQNFTWEALTAAQIALDRLTHLLATDNASSGPTATNS
ncbi:MAG TPA: cysteine--tRNA ligase, partial [Candidatus Paceibacterota bacterium]